MTITPLVSAASRPASTIDAPARPLQARLSSLSTAATTAGVSTGVSRVGQLLSTLEGLAESDPDTFRTATSRLSTMLSSAAARADGREADWLSSMAERFEAAAASGRMPSFQAPPTSLPAYSSNGLPTPIPTFRPELPDMWAEIFSVA